MPTFPIKNDKNIVSFQIMIAGISLGEQYPVYKIETENAINKIVKAKLVVLMELQSRTGRNFDISEEDKFEPGKEIEIKLGYEGNESTVFKGIIINIEIKAEYDQNKLIIECSNKALKMTLGRKSRFFKNKKDSEIISSLIKENGLAAEVDSTSISQDQQVQYNATDWDFIQKRAEANGLFVYVKNNKILVKKPDISATAKLAVTYGEDVYRISAKVDATNQLEKIAATSWNPAEQEMQMATSASPTVNKQGNLSSKRLAKVLGISDYQLSSSGPIPPDNLKEWASGQLLKSRLSRIYGEVEITGTSKAELNSTIDLKGFGARINGTALITKVKQRVENGTWITTIGFGLTREHFSQNSTTTETTTSGILPAIQGLQIGKVKKIEGDPNGQTRVLVDIPVIASSGDGIWARLAQFYATKGKGSFFMPENGDEVIVGFLNNDPRFAIVLGSLFSSKITAPHIPDKYNSIKAIVTKNDLKLEFNDKDKVINIETPGGNKISLSDKNKIVSLEDQHGNSIKMDSNGITLKTKKKITLDAQSDISLDSKGKVKLSAPVGDILLKGNNIIGDANMDFKASGVNLTLEGHAEATLKGGATTTVKGAVVQIN